MLFLLCRSICFGCRSWFVTFVNPLFSEKKSKPDDTDSVYFLWSLITAWIFTDQRLYKKKRHVYLIDLSIHFHSVIFALWNGILPPCHNIFRVSRYFYMHRNNGLSNAFLETTDSVYYYTYNFPDFEFQ